MTPPKENISKNVVCIENKKIKTVHIDRKNMHGMGTPEDLADFEKHYESSKE